MKRLLPAKMTSEANKMVTVYICKTSNSLSYIIEENNLSTKGQEFGNRSSPEMHRRRLKNLLESNRSYGIGKPANPYNTWK